MSLLILRLHPIESVEPDVFEASLTGLTISARDLAFGNLTDGDPLGQAQYSPPPDPAHPEIPDPGTQIVQHVPETFPPGTFVPTSVATAVIEDTAGGPEHATRDLVLEITRGTGEIIHRQAYYNVPVSNAALPGDPADFPGLQPTSLHLAIPAAGVQIEGGDASVFLPEDGTPPNYQDLKDAIEVVLGNDPGGAPDLTTLTPQQCRHIAFEIAWNRNEFPLPDRDNELLEAIYTAPDSSDDKEDRGEFEGELLAYYAKHNAEAERLAAYVFAVSAALYCEQKSSEALTVRFRFPVQLGAPPPGGKVKQAEVVLKGPGNAAIDPGFTVSAEYFYALGAVMPSQTSAEQRYRMATLDDEQRLRDEFARAIELRIIDEPAAMNRNQAARRLPALGVGKAGAPECEVAPNAADPVHAMIQAWLDFAGADINAFWNAVGFPHEGAHLDIVLCAITANHAPLIVAIKAPPFSVTTVAQLAAKTAQQWRDLFLPPGGAPQTALLPPFTKPGSVEERVAAFIRHVKKFFDVTIGANAAAAPVIGAPPTLGQADFDPIAELIAFYTALDPAFTVGDPLNEGDFQIALSQVFPDDPEARSWLEQAFRALNDVYMLADIGIPDLRFSIAEALYARGFTSVQTVSALSLEDFRDALTGTIAYDHADLIYQNAGGGGGPEPPPPEEFKPVNPDGLLTNCIPPAHLSPLGPVAYLSEMLRVAETSTCETPFPLDAITDLGAIIADRRGLLGDLHATSANLQTPLPVIDMVNECLEAMAATDPPTAVGFVYDTAVDEVAGHKLEQPGPQPLPAPGPQPFLHDPTTLFEALPEHSSPATPVKKPGAYDNLKNDFSAPVLPYSQPVDVARAYLQQLGTSRYATMRTFREEITELVLDPSQEPADFQRHLWRYPVRIDIAREYLGITPEEYDLLFTTTGQLELHELYGFESAIVDGESWLDIVVQLPEFLARTCLTYCQFIALWKSEFVIFRRAGADPDFPDCEPCCLAAISIEFVDPADPAEALERLAVFIRLWHKLRLIPNARYSFQVLRDICEVLQLYDNAGAINPDFIRQLAAFQILRDDLGLQLADPAEPNPDATGDERTHLLALWVGPAATKWFWAVDELLDRIGYRAQVAYKCDCRPPEFIKLLASNLDSLSLLAGFDPDSANDTWHALPTHTLRFAEVLAKIYASDWGIGEILFLFTVLDHLQGNDPFFLQTHNEALDLPFDLPDDAGEYSLWAMRRKLLDVQVPEETVAAWTWTRIDATLRESFGHTAPVAGIDPLLSLGEHFFPSILEREGIPVEIKRRQYRVGLDPTAPLMWNTPPEGPFRYDTDGKELWTEVPLTDEAVIAKLSRIRQLTATEQTAVRELYFLPRVDLATFGFIFEDFGRAEERLLQEPSEEARWNYFRAQFALCYARSQTIAEHLTAHVDWATGRSNTEGNGLAWRLLKHLFADENKAIGPWETDAGQVPPVTWSPPPNGGAFAALLGITGTGITGEYVRDEESLNWEDDDVIWTDSAPNWREVRGPMDAFGPEENAWNSPIPTIIPAMDFAIAPDQLRFVGVRNGFALANKDGAMLGGAQGFAVHWHGVLLIDKDGNYRFAAGAPTANGELPDFESAKRRRWRVTLARGQKTWVLLSHKWPDTHAPGDCTAPVALKRGAYSLTVEFIQPHLSFDGPEDICPQTTGLQLKYSGPDSGDRFIAIPLKQLFRELKDGTLAERVVGINGAAQVFLERRFTSTLRDIRRTYERAFKALLFCHRFWLSAKPIADDRESEIGYMLAHAEDFVGISYFRLGGGGFDLHGAFFDFNFLPVDDNYRPPPFAQDQRIAPSEKRQQALFDWWERIFDYTVMRTQTATASEAPAWFVFHEAAELHPDPPAQLLRHIGVDLSHADLVLRFYLDFEVKSAELEDERWTIRVWKAEKWIRCVLLHFFVRDIRDARPDLWASDDPGFIEAGEVESGNMNLTRFVRDGCFENGEPRRYKEIKRLNDGLRLRAREALLAYLCGMDRVPLPWGVPAKTPKDLSELLLLDVEAGLCQKASRIEQAISTVQRFVQRARLGLEPGFVVNEQFILLWDRHFATFAVWEACTRRTIYRENWIDWDELIRARRVEAFRFLESEVRRATLTIAEPGGLEYWPNQRPPAYPGLTILQSREPSQIARLNPPREGLGLLGTPERDARPSWLAAMREFSLESPELGPLQGPAKLPFWIQAAIRLGTRFIRVAAAGIPPASQAFEHRHPERETGCCVECGKPHPVVVDEYYFWLFDTRYYDQVAQDADVGTDPEDTNSDWHREEELPKLLHWPSNPMVHLAWCRVHNGEFQQPRRSFEGVRIDLSLAPRPELIFLGRVADSLNFRVDGGVAAPGFDPPPPEPGFRYDLATDTAVVLPLVADPPDPPVFPGPLPVYPYFVYFEPVSAS